MTITPDNATRITAALLGTIGTWMEQVQEIADCAIPFTDNKRRALHLLMNMTQAHDTLERLLNDPGPPD